MISLGIVACDAIFYWHIIIIYFTFVEQCIQHIELFWLSEQTMVSESIGEFVIIF